MVDDKPTAGTTPAGAPKAPGAAVKAGPAKPPAKPAGRPAKIVCKYFDMASGLCMNMYPCDFKMAGLQCKSQGTALPQKGGAARPAPAAAPKAAAAKAKAPVQAPKMLGPAKAPAAPPKPEIPPEQVETKGTMAECANGSEGFYYKGICMGGEHDHCPHQTPLRFPVKTAVPCLQKGTFAKCMKYGIERCPRGDRSLYHPQSHICLATGKAHCRHQVGSLMVPLEDGREYAYCDRYEEKS
jgi:hypothetical protein